MDPDSLSAPLVKSVGACVFFIFLSNCDNFFFFQKIGLAIVNSFSVVDMVYA